MSTNAFIAVKTADDVCNPTGYDVIYLHNDGYTSYTGKTLVQKYGTPELANELVRLGDLSSIRNSLEETEAYYRDRGEVNWDDVKPQTFGNLEAVKDMAGSDYLYVYADGEWTAYMHHERLVIDMGI